MSTMTGKGTEISASRSAETPVRRTWKQRLRAAGKELANFVYLHCGYVQVRDFIEGRSGCARMVVVYYHRIGEADVLTRSPDQLRRDLAHFSRRYDCITLSEMCRRIAAGEPQRRPALAVTFDDGYRDNYTEALPILIDSAVPASFFVATGYIGTDREFPHDQRRSAKHFAKLTWHDLRKMEDAGFEIASHGVEHINFAQADEATIRRELEESLATINSELRQRPRAFSFPWGKPQDMSESAIAAVRSAGYYACASAWGGVNRRGGDVFDIRRVDVGNGQLSDRAVRARVAGFDPDHRRMKKTAKLRNA